MAHPYQYLSNTPLDQAREMFLTRCAQLRAGLKTELIPTADAAGRITAAAVYARRSVPHYDASAMDGVAVAARRTFGAGESRPVTLEQADFRRVDTGDPIPPGFDAVVMVEDINEGADGSVQITAPATPWQNIRQIGEDVCAGDMVIPRYTAVTAATVGALLASGAQTVEVLTMPLVGIIPTGDEIVSAAQELKTGDIPEFNSAMFSAYLRENGCAARVHPVVPDDPAKISEALTEMARGCDIVLLGAGSSAGREDYAAAVLADVGEVLLHGVAIKPGKPVVLGFAKNTPVVGVPGYPVSGMIVLRELVLPFVGQLTHQRLPAPKTVPAELARSVNSSLKHREFLEMRVGWIDGRYVATPVSRGAGAVTSLVRADGYWEIPADTERAEAGETVDVTLSRDEQTLRRTVCVIGSHDPLFDELADLAREEGFSLSSAHVGSMGGLLAMQRGHAHLAGIHLLDAESGRYNTAAFEQYLGGKGCALLRGVGRIQGFMTAPGGRGVKTIADLAQGGLRFVNRQRGSGTRVLLDYLLQKASIDPETINGYAREETTHTAVAAIVASGGADCGLGIYSAAKAFGLDFTPVASEQYDLAASERFLESELGQGFLRLLGSAAFAERLAAMGGYTADGIGARLL